MPQGMQCFNSAGVMTLDFTHRLGKILATFSSGTVDSSTSVPQLAGAGTPFAFITTDENYLTESYAYPTISISGTTVSWAFTDWKMPYSPYEWATRRAVTISVGVF